MSHMYDQVYVTREFLEQPNFGFVIPAPTVSLRTSLVRDALLTLSKSPSWSYTQKDIHERGFLKQTVTTDAYWMGLGYPVSREIMRSYKRDS